MALIRVKKSKNRVGTGHQQCQQCELFFVGNNLSRVSSCYF